jgi:hypothetical protein
MASTATNFEISPRSSYLRGLVFLSRTAVIKSRTDFLIGRANNRQAHG